MKGDLQLFGIEYTLSVQYTSMFLQKHYGLNIFLHEPTARHNVVCLSDSSVYITSMQDTTCHVEKFTVNRTAE